MNKAQPRIGGGSLEPAAFRVEKASAESFAEVLPAILQGRVLGVQVQGYVEPIESQRLRERFLENIALRERSDEVPGLHVGAYHYGKSTEEYFAEVAETQGAVDHLLGASGDIIGRVEGSMKLVLGRKGMILRAAQDGTRKAGKVRALWWTGSGKYLLAPHDDMAQLYNPLQRGFEIQEVRSYDVVAVNLYPIISEGGGELEIWNIEPDEECRREFGVEYTGYPYPSEALKGIQSLVLRIGQGDLVIFNGGYVHAARGYESRGGGKETERLLLTFFLGCISSECAVWWT